MAKWKTLVFLVLIHCSTVMCQDYVAYQQVINRVDRMILARNPAGALGTLDSVGAQYRFIYARHCLKALQVACVVNDSVRASYWLGRAFLQGVPLWLFRCNKLTVPALGYRTSYSTLQHYDSLHAAYLSSINIELAGEVERIMKTDARYTRKLNNSSFVTGRAYHFLRWRRNNTMEIRKMSAFILQYGYPGERLIGLPQALEDSAATAPLAVVNGIDWAAGNNLVLFMYLHYCSTRRSDISPMLFPFVSTGYLPAENYARICDYLAA